MEDTWITKENKSIKHKDLKDSHLLNILAMIKRKAKEFDGNPIEGGGFDASEMWVSEGDEEEWLEKLGYKSILKEVKRRKLL